MISSTPIVFVALLFRSVVVELYHNIITIEEMKTLASELILK